MTSTLRADAPAFVPSALQSQTLDVPGQEYWYTIEDDGEMEVSEEQLLELEAADEWVCLMAELDEMETEHMINLALSYAPAAAQVIEDEVMARRKGSARGARKHN